MNPEEEKTQTDRGKALFDAWPDAYDRWFTTPVGRLVKEYELGVIMDLLEPAAGERILDAGCGTGIFTLDFLTAGACIAGLDISLPMLLRAKEKASDAPLRVLAGDILRLPFVDEAFDKTVSVTALEFIQDAEAAVRELFRVTKRGGSIVVASLNSLSPWAARRKADAQTNQDSIFREALFRSPDELRALAPVAGTIKSAVYFRKDENPDKIEEIERRGQLAGLLTAAFLAIGWKKP
ncbi:MAG: class I SAM-dependent methyltransferase [Pseudomonadota bacterium]